MIPISEIQQEIHEAIGAGRAELLVTRTCETADVDGIKKILKDYPVGAIYIFPQCVHGKRQNIERFYKLLDGRLQAIGRSALLQEWFGEINPPITIGDIVHLKSNNLTNEGEAMACLVAPGIYSFIWVRRISGNIEVGTYALCGQSHSLKNLIEMRQNLFSVFTRIRPLGDAAKPRA